MAGLFQFKRGAASKWVSVNPILLSGEPGYETDTGKFKVGNGVNDWDDLPYSSGVQGIQGDPGIDGQDGTDGYTPVKGVDYFDGATGPKGDTGEQGLQGEQGIQGPPGNDGAGVAIQGSGTYIQSSGTLQFQNANNFTFGLNTEGIMTVDFLQSTHAHPYQSVGEYLTTAQPVGNYLTTAAQSVHTHDYQSTGNYLTTYTQSTHSHETYAAITHTHSNLYQSTGDYLTTAMLSQNSSLYLPIGNSTQWATGTLSTALMPLNYSSGFQTATLATKFLTTAAVSNHTHSDLYQSTGAYLTTAMLSQNTSLFQYTSNTSNITSNAFAATGTTKFAGSGTTCYNATMTLNSLGLQLSVAAPGAAAENNWVNISGNVLGNTTASGSTINWVGGDNITLSGLNDSQIRIDAAAGGGAPNRLICEIIPGEYLTRVINLSASQISNRPFFVPFWLDGNGLVASTVRVMMSWVTNSTGPIMTYGAAIYTENNSTQLGLFDSTTATVSYASSQSASYTGIRYWDITGMTKSMSEGRKVLAMFFSAAASANINASLYGASNLPAFVGFVSGASNTATTANTLHAFPFWGRYSANSGSFPSAVDLTQIYGGRSADLVDLYAVIKQI